MAKRFIDSNFFKHPFVRSLKAPLKSLYTFIICDCDAAGFWAPDFEIASIYTDQKFSLTDFEKHFSSKYVKNENGEYFFPDFIQRQYDGKLRRSNPAHKNVIKKLEDHGFLVDFFSIENDEKGGDFYFLNKGALKGLQSSFEASKDKDTVMVKEKETRANEKQLPIPDFNEFLDYALEKQPDLDHKSVKLKYESWKENGWKDGNDKKIKNWKVKILNTIPFLQTKEKIIDGKPRIHDSDYNN